jgi:hypothetical protein
MNEFRWYLRRLTLDEILGLARTQNAPQEFKPLIISELKRRCKAIT